MNGRRGRFRRLVSVGLGIAAILAAVAATSDASAQDSWRKFTPGALLPPGKGEVKAFSSLYTQRHFFDEAGNKVSAGARASYFTSVVSAMRGISPRLNLGIDLVPRGVRDESFPPGSRERWALSAVGLRAKVAPWRRLERLATEFAAQVATHGNLAATPSRPYLDEGDPVFSSRILFDAGNAQPWSLYFETALQWRLGRVDAEEQREASDGFTTAFKGILNRELTARWTLYAAEELFLNWRRDGPVPYFFQSGLGTKFRTGESIEWEALATLFPLGRSSGAGWTIGFGVRWLPE